VKIDDILTSGNIPFKKIVAPLSADNAYWGKLVFENNALRARLFFIYVGKNDFIDAFFVENGKVIHSARSGYLYPVDEKIVPQGSYFIPVQISANTTQEVYIRVEDKIHNDPEFDLKLYKGGTWAKEMLGTHLVDFVFQGIFWLIILYNLFMYQSTKIRAFLLYSFYLFFVSVNFLFFSDVLREFILPANPQLTIYFIPIILLVLTSYWMFIRDLIDIKKHFILYDRWVIRIAIINIGLFVLTIVWLLVMQDIYMASSFMQFVFFVNVLLVIGFIYRLKGSKNQIAGYFIYGTSTMIVLALIDVALWDTNTSSGNLTKYGLLIEIAVFSLGLIHKKRLYDREKKKVLDKQMDQHKVNENLAQWQKEELEKIIVSRTKKVKKKNKKLKKAIKKANQAAKVKSDFLSVMSHEIRTPMNAVIGTIHLLLDEQPNQSQLDHLKTLKFSSENLLILINDILDYSKVESGMVDLEQIDFDLRELTKGIGNTYEDKAKENGVQFNILINHNIPSMLRGDPARITQILNNLISNAFKFTPKGEIKLLINLLHKSNGRVKLEFSVEDTGIGISKDNLDFIFESFTQANTATSRKYGGTGLGLAITKRLIALFDSQIFVKSKIDKGSKFYFSLFLEEVKHAAESKKQDQVEMIKAVTGKQVLVVDDNEINLMMAKRFLDKWGLKCDVVTSGKSALLQIFNIDYDLILMDLQMPEMDGYEATATIRSLEGAMQNIPIVAVSADSFGNVKFKIAEVRIDDFLAKPFNPNELLEMVYKHTLSEYSSVLKNS
jgi:signal transduction histidine kinase/ActR/RegA family two-component response regulator